MPLRREGLVRIRWLLVAGMLLSPRLGPKAWAQTEASNTSSPGWYLKPTLDLAMVYDDNLFFGAEIPESSAFGRFGAGLAFERRAPSKLFRTGYSFSSELFPRRLEELNDLLARQHAFANFTGQVGAGSEVAMNASFLTSNRPEDATGIELGRRRSKSYDLGGSYRRLIGGAHSWDLSYLFGLRELDDGIELGLSARSFGHSFSTGWIQRYSARANGTVRYAYRIFIDPDLAPILGGEETLQSHLIDYSWSGAVSPRATFTFAFGPRYSETYAALPGRETLAEKSWVLTPEGRVSLGYRWQRSAITIGYSRSQLQSFGVTGVSDNQSLAFSWRYQPARRFEVTVTPGYFRNTRAERAIQTVRAGLVANWDITRTMQLRFNYLVSRQDGRFILIGEDLVSNEAEILRQVVTVTLGFGKAYRLN